MEFHQQSGVMWQPLKGETELPRTGMGVAGHSKESIIFFFLEKKNPMWALTTCYVLTFGVVCAAVSMHMMCGRCCPWHTCLSHLCAHAKCL